LIYWANNLKILIYGVNYAPELTGIGKYSGEMAEWLAEQGHDVCVVTAPPYYPEWKISEDYRSHGYVSEVVQGVKVIRCPLYVPSSPSGLKRIIHLASFAMSSFPIMVKQLFWRPDVVMVIEPPLFCAPTTWLISRIAGATCWLHVQDFEVDAAFDLGIIPFAWMKRWVSGGERWLMRCFDKVSTISHAMLMRLDEKGVDKPAFFPNWADLSRIQFDKAGRDMFRAQLGVESDELLCLYAGNISMKQGLEIVLEAAERLEGCRFIICGSGANRASLEQLAKDMNLSNVHFLPLQPLEKLAALLSAADVHLVVQKAGAADLVMPSKLTNILAIGGVALVTAEEDSELGRMAEGKDAAVYRCNPESLDAFIEALSILKDESLRQTISEKARAYALQHIAKDEVLLQFERKLCEVIQ